MKIWKEGDRSRGLCETCRKLVETRFARRVVALERPAAEVPDVLVAECVECGGIVAIPAQSSPRLQEARRRESQRIEIRLPKELDDVLRLVASHYMARYDVFGASLIRYYVGRMGTEARVVRRVVHGARTPLAMSPSKGRLSLSIEKPVWDAAWEASRREGLRDKSEVIRGIIIAAAVDSGLLPAQGMKPSTRCREALQAIALA